MKKNCIVCKQEKEISCFYKHPQMKDGHVNRCIDCAKENVRAARLRNAEHYRAYDKTRAMHPGRVAMRRRYQHANPDVISRNKAAWQARNPLKREAHIIVGNALRDGLVVRPPCCELCRRSVEVQGHHEDYSAPLWLAWLCTRCHRLVHNGTVALGRFHQQRRPF